MAKVSFTGSTATGQRIAEAAAKNGVATCMELGGKSCLIVFDDADIDDAVEWACFGCFWTNGQASPFSTGALYITTMRVFLA